MDGGYPSGRRAYVITWTRCDGRLLSMRTRCDGRWLPIPCPKTHRAGETNLLGRHYECGTSRHLFGECYLQLCIIHSYVIRRTLHHFSQAITTQTDSNSHLQNSVILLSFSVEYIEGHTNLLIVREAAGDIFYTAEPRQTPPGSPC